MNDIQQGLDYENISYTKEQNDQLLETIENAKVSATLAKEDYDEAMLKVKEVASAKVIIKDSGWYADSVQSYECYSQDQSIKLLQEALSEAARFKPRYVGREIMAVFAITLSIAASVLWIFF